MKTPLHPPLPPPLPPWLVGIKWKRQTAVKALPSPPLELESSPPGKTCQRAFISPLEMYRKGQHSLDPSRLLLDRSLTNSNAVESMPHPSMCSAQCTLEHCISPRDLLALSSLGFSLVFSACLIIVNVKSFFFLGLCSSLRYGFQIAICAY